MKPIENISSDTSDSLSPRETNYESENGQRVKEEARSSEIQNDLSKTMNALHLEHNHKTGQMNVNGSDSGVSVKHIRDDELGNFPQSGSPKEWKKSYSGLSKSALERVEKRKSEEIRKRELAEIRMREKEAEDRLRMEKEAREAELRKQEQIEKNLAEMKRLEELIKAEERKKEEV